MGNAEHVAPRDEVRSLTVIPPWSLAICQHEKSPENRPRNLAGAWRGRVLILSSLRKWDDLAARFIAAVTGTPAPSRRECHPGHYVGAADLVDVHHATEARCADAGGCTPWGEPDVWHLVFINAIRFAEPIPATGHLGLRRVTDPALIRAARRAEPSSAHA